MLNLLRRREPRPDPDEEAWQAATSLQDLCGLTIRWLQGELNSTPGYLGSVDVDEADAPGLTETLILLNQHGFMTTSSQAGFDGLGYGDWHWQQHAAVTGFATYDTCRWLLGAVAGTRFQTLEDVCRRRGPNVFVTYVNGRPYTRFGVQSRADIKFSWDGCGGEALAALQDAWQVTIYDPVAGPNDLWPVLRDTAS